MASNGTENDTGERGNSVQQLVGDLTILIRQEIELAKEELGQKIQSAGIGAGMLSASAACALISLGCLTALVALLLALVIPAWSAVLVVTVLWAAATAILALLGKKKLQDAAPFVPERTIESVKEDLAWARSRSKRSEP